MRKINLFKANATLIYVENERLIADGITESVGELRKRNYPEIKATVPGNALRDMADAGVTEEPYFGENCLCEKFDCLHLFYVHHFIYDGSLENPVLVFSGIDTVSDIFLNGKHIGSTENMFIEHEMSVCDALKNGENELLVHIKPTVIEARKCSASVNESAQKYNYAGLYIRKAAHSFGWDIFPRLTLGGIWRAVHLEERKSERIKQLYCYTNSVSKEEGKANIACFFEVDIKSDIIKRYSIEFKGTCGNSSFQKRERLWHTSGKIRLDVEDAKLWWPRNYGAADLYDVTVTLFKDNEKIDSCSEKMGIRTAELKRASLTDENGRGEFCFIINGKRVFCMGTNWVSVDALHACDGERIHKILPMLCELNCNMLRVWGGGVYETDEFYDFCDENGIMVWQDFMMGCAVYPEDDGFARKIELEATAAVKRLRRHASIVLWAGDNENDIAYLGWYDRRRNPNENRLTREVIPLVLKRHDFLRPYLPSSPYVDDSLYKSDLKYAVEDHLWGPRDYFKGDYYKNSLCHFVSETGYHGCPSPKSIEKFISGDRLFTATDKRNWKDIENNGEWLAHSSSMEAELSAPYSYRIRLMADQVTTLFGESVPLSLSDFAMASQISQAEAKKFFIEKTRMAKWRRTGILWWNLIDGWPQISDSVVDYYFIKKLAYHYIKRSQTPIAIMAEEPDGNGYTDIYAVNDTQSDASAFCKVTDFKSGEILFEGEFCVSADSTKKIYRLAPQNCGSRRFLLMEYKLGEKTYKNHYIENIKGVDYKEYIEFIKQIGFDEFEGF